jgi:hypothetical protein
MAFAQTQPAPNSGTDAPLTMPLFTPKAANH